MGCLSSKPADAPTGATTPAPTSTTNGAPSSATVAATATTSASKKTPSADFQEVNLSKPAKAKATPVATPSAVDDTVVKEMTAAVESVKPNTRAAATTATTTTAAKTKEAPASKTIPKPKPAGPDGDAADGLTKSKSQRKNERKRERAKQRKAEEKSTKAIGLRDGPVVSVQRDLY